MRTSHAKHGLHRFLLLLLLVTGCEVPFNPKGEYEEKLVVYSILDPTKTVQFARVYRTYNVEGLDAWQNTVDPQVRNASVRIQEEGGRIVTFRDTVLKRDVQDRYREDIIAYYADQFSPSIGKRYNLEVSVPGFGKATASVAVPEPYTIYVNRSRTRALLADSLNPCNCIEVSLLGGKGSKGHLTRFFVNYVVKRRGQPDLQMRREVPLQVRRRADGSEVFVYPSPDRIHFVEFSKKLFFATIDSVLRSDPTAEIKVETVTFISHALEPNLYNYYMVARGFGDPFSVRLDLPDYTNIKGGIGVFGAVAVDSLTLPI